MDDNFASLTSHIKDSPAPVPLGLTSVSTADRFMRGRGVAGPQTSPGTMQTGRRAGVHGASLPEGAGLKQRKDPVLWGEMHLSFNPTALLANAV